MARIKIGGKVRPFKFGWNAIAIFCRGKNISMQEMAERLQKGQPEDIRDMIFSGLVAEDPDATFSPLDVGNWMDNLNGEELAEAIKAINEGMTGKKKAGQPKK